MPFVFRLLARELTDPSAIRMVCIHGPQTEQVSGAETSHRSMMSLHKTETATLCRKNLGLAAGCARRIAFGAVLTSLVAAQGRAETPGTDAADPVVSLVFVNTADPAVPEATEFIVDLPSARHWSRYQLGHLGPWAYVLYPDGTARILDSAPRSPVAATLACVAGESCRVDMVDSPGFLVPVGEGAQPVLPETTELDAAARYLARWILAGTAPVRPEPPAPRPIALAPALEVSPAVVDERDPVLDEPDSPPLAAEPPPTETAPVCSEAEPFVPTACAEPTGPIAARATPVVAAPQPEPQGGRPTDPDKPVAAGAARKGPVRFIEKYNVNCSITGSSSLGFLIADPDRQGIAKPRASLGCSARLTDRLSVRLSLIEYINPKDQQPWDPDYTYAFTYRFNDKLSLGYSNYSARFSDGGSPVAGLLDGKLRASYKLPAFRLGNDKTIPCTASLGLPDPSKQSLNLSCGYAVTKKLRIGGTSYFYVPGTQGTYQPDFSYTASYRFNDDWLLSYNNYSNNRWSWNKGDAPGPGVLGGSLSLTYKFRF